MNSTAPRTPIAVLASTLGFRVSQGTPKNFVADALLLGTRLFAGVWMARAGLDKIPTPDWMIDQVSQVGFPAPYFFAVCAEMAEYAGGLLLALGLFTRPAAFFLVFTMGVAAFGFHGVRPILDYHITQGFLWLYVAFLVVGPGRLSLDHLFSRVSTSNTTGDTKPKRYILLGALVSAPIIGYGLFREFTMTWEPDPEQASTATMDGVETITLAGSFNGWDINATPLTEGDDGVWSTTITLDEGITELKFVANGSWDLNMGDDDQTASAAPFSGIGDLDADNIRVFIQTPGEYRVSLDTEDFSYTIEAAED